ncbi:MAG: hypothetical protein ABI407_07770 [Bradyrhizobium sp.]
MLARFSAPHSGSNNPLAAEGENENDAARGNFSRRVFQSLTSVEAAAAATTKGLFR